MANKWTRSTATLLSLLFSPLAFAADTSDDDHDDGDGAAEEAPAPDAVRLSMARAFPRAEIVGSTIERHELGDAWRLRLRERLTTREVVVDPGGDIVAQSEELPPAAAPAHVKRAIARQFGSPSLWHVQHFTGAGEEAWLVTFSRGERTGHALFDGEGKLVRGEFEPPARGRA